MCDTSDEQPSLASLHDTYSIDQRPAVVHPPAVTRTHHETYGRPDGSMYCRQCGCDSYLISQEVYDATPCVWPNDYHKTLMSPPDRRPAVVHPPAVVSGHYGHPVMAFLDLVEAETMRAAAKHPALHSAHEAYAVILEEVDEFKLEVWKQTARRDRAAMLAELVQIAAMAARTAVDLGLIGELETSATGLADCV